MRSRRLLGIGGAVAAATALIVSGLLVAMAGAASPPPAFVQQVSVHSSSVASVKLTPAASVTAGNRLVVEVGVWSDGRRDRLDRDRHGRQHLHRGAALHGLRRHRDERLDRADHRRRRHQADHHGHADRQGRHRGRGVGVLRPVDRRRCRGGRSGHASPGPRRGRRPSPPAPRRRRPRATSWPSASTSTPASATRSTAGSGYTAAHRTSPAPNMEPAGRGPGAPRHGRHPNATAGAGAKRLADGHRRAPGRRPGRRRRFPARRPAWSATAGDGRATVTWTAPTDGGSPITSYTVTPYIGSTAQTPATVNGPAPPTSATITGLTNGTTYTFTVSATNAVGTGPASAPSNAVTPAASAGGQWWPLLTWPMRRDPLDPDQQRQAPAIRRLAAARADPGVGPEHAARSRPQTAPDSIFCSGMAQLPDGRMLVIGGYGGLSPATSGSSTRTSSTPRPTPGPEWPTCTPPRWYPDLTELADGRYVAISGNSTDASTWADTPEVYDPATNTWTLLTGRVHLAGPRGGVPVLLPGAERQGLHHRPVRGQVLRARRRQPDLDPGRRFERCRQRLVGDVPAGQDPLQRRRREPRHAARRRSDDGRDRPQRADPTGSRPRR